MSRAVADATSKARGNVPRGVRLCVCAAASVFLILESMAPAACASPAVSPTQSSDDVVVSSFGRTVTVKVGQTLRIVRPTDAAEWQVDYSADVLEALTPSEKMRSPGPDGWRFKAVAAGETDVTLTAVTPVSPNGGAPPPAPPHFTATIRVQ